MVKGRGYLLLRVFFMFGLVLLSLNSVSALGASPAIIEIDFIPGLKQTFTYNVLGVAPDTELELFVTGGLAEYIKLDRETLVGPGEFNVILELPDSLEKPGKNVAFIGIQEKIDEELVTTVGTSVGVNPALIVFVPYPGKFLDISLTSHDVNVGEDVRFELNLISRGDEDVTTRSRIEISSGTQVLETLVFQDREIPSQDEIKLKKILKTTNFNPGNYNAAAIVEYGSKTEISEAPFRIGELRIDMVNYTKRIIMHQFSKFVIEIESGWNNNIEAVSADIAILNGTQTLIEIETTSTDLTPWEKKSIVGYFDSTEIPKGFYDANITLNYIGKDNRKSSSEIVRVELVKEGFDLMLIVYITSGIILLSIAIFLIRKFLVNKRK